MRKTAKAMLAVLAVTAWSVAAIASVEAGLPGRWSSPVTCEDLAMEGRGTCTGDAGCAEGIIDYGGGCVADCFGGGYMLCEVPA